MSAFGCLPSSAFFSFLAWHRQCRKGPQRPMEPRPSVAQNVARAAIRFQEQWTGHRPTAVTVVVSGDTLVVTLHGAFSPAEIALARTREGALKVQEFHRQLFANSSEGLREEIRRITGVAVREAAAEVEAATGSVVHAFTTGTMVQVYLLAEGVLPDAWNANPEGGPS